MRWQRTWLLLTAASTLLALAWVVGLGVAVWSELEPAERVSLEAVLRPRAALALLLALLLPVLFALLWRRWIRAYPRAVARLRDEVRIIGNANPGHRVAETGAPEMRELGAAINGLADAHQALGRDVDARIGAANARLAQETSRLAALMAELTQGVLVCNREGRILLYNASASLLLAGATSADAAAPVGLNRSIFGILDKGPIVHALQQLTRRLEQRLPHPVARFVTTRRNSSACEHSAAADGAAPPGQLLRAQMVPLRESKDGTDTLTGFVLLLDDITSEVESESRRDALLRLLTEGSRAPLANLRAAAETLQAHPAMEPALRGRFVAAIHEEAERLSRQLEDALARGDDGWHSPWPREDILAADLVFALQRSFEAGLGLSCRCEGSTPELWLQLDSHSMVQAVTHLAGALRSALGLREVVLELSPQGRFARLDLHWQGEPLAPERLHEWEQQRFSLGDAGRGATLGDVLMQHGAELWTQPARDTGLQRLCLQLPTVRPEPVAAAEAGVPGRPVYYDFDLFRQTPQSTTLDNLPLAELSCTVFDTETTGLAPADGDEIISIGAVRIVNARLLAHEAFDRLIKPRRAVSDESQRVHGITPQMLAGQPPLEQVLPAFARFAEDTVLVAHNAAFDLRFLELAQRRTGLRFEQPVLDTLLLSSLVHPGHHDAEHQLERIAQRLGLAVVGRHTALGDAIVTAEVFLKLLPLLAERGIRTLGQAREASRRSVYAALDY